MDRHPQRHRYVDGVQAGWITGTRGVVAGLAPGEHTFEMTSLNSAGESVRSAPVTIMVEGSQD